MMARNIDDPRSERRVAEPCRLGGESRPEAIRELHPSATVRRASVMRWLREDVWPRIPPDQIGRRLSPAAEAEILGYGPDGV